MDKQVDGVISRSQKFSEKYHTVRYTRSNGFEIELDIKFSTNYFARVTALGRTWAAFPTVTLVNDRQKVIMLLVVNSTLHNRHFTFAVREVRYTKEPRFAKVQKDGQGLALRPDLKQPTSVTEYLKAYEELNDAAHLRNAYAEVIRVLTEVMQEDPPKEWT